MKSLLLKYFIVFAGLLPQIIYAQMDKENGVKAYEQVCAFKDLDSAVYLVFEYQADTNSRRLERSYSGSYAKISSQRRNEKKYMYSLFTFVNDEGNFCGAFPADISTFFEDTVIVEFLVKERDQFVSVSTIGDELPKQFEFQFHNHAKLGLEARQYERTNSSWLIKHQEIFSLNSEGIYSPQYLMQHQVSIGNQCGLSGVGFIDLVLIDVFKRDRLWFEPLKHTSYSADYPDIFIFGGEGQLTLLIGKKQVKSVDFEFHQGEVIHFYFPIDAFENVSGRAKVQYEGNTIIENYVIPDALSDLEALKKMFSQLPDYNENTVLITKKVLEQFYKKK